MSRLFRKQDDVPKRSLWQRVKDVVRTDIGVLWRGGVDQGSLEALETLLIESDFGVTTSLALVADVERLAKRGDVKTEAEFHDALANGIETALRSGNSDPALNRADNRSHRAARDRREWRGEDDVHRQAVRATRAGRAQGARRCCGYVQGRRHRPASRLGAARQS